MSFAKLFRLLREDLGLTQTEFAKALKVSQSQISKMEKSRGKKIDAEVFCRAGRLAMKRASLEVTVEFEKMMFGK